MEKVQMVEIVKKENENKEKFYLICLTGENNPDQCDWNFLEGREESIEYIIDSISWINFYDSFILVENLPLEKRVSIYNFMRHCKEKGFTDFDIDEYIDNQDHERSVDDIFNLNDTDKVSMEDMLVGNVMYNEEENDG